MNYCRKQKEMAGQKPAMLVVMERRWPVYVSLPFGGVSSNFVSADFRKMRTDSFQKSRTT